MFALAFTFGFKINVFVQGFKYFKNINSKLFRLRYLFISIYFGLLMPFLFDFLVSSLLVAGFCIFICMHFLYTFFVGTQVLISSKLKFVFVFKNCFNIRVCSYTWLYFQPCSIRYRCLALPTRRKRKLPLDLPSATWRPMHQTITRHTRKNWSAWRRRWPRWDGDWSKRHWHGGNCKRFSCRRDSAYQGTRHSRTSRAAFPD